MDKRVFGKLDMISDAICLAYRNGVTLRTLADLHHVSIGTVRKVLIANNESLRPRGRRPKKEK